MRVKICGITNTRDALLCSGYGADALGFVFYKESKRYVTPQTAKSICSQLPFFISKIGVFVDEKPHEINKIGKLAGLNAVQLHGSETADIVKELELPVLKSFRINSDFDFTLLDEFGDCGILLDTYSSSELGGTGRSFDWKLIPEKYRTRIILAGGISAANITHVIEEINPAGVDLSSSVEKSPGIKDENQIKTFFEKVTQSRK